MYLTTEKKEEIFAGKGFQKIATDTGSAESQIALFTFRIIHLTEHLKSHKHDYSTRAGLLKLLDYLYKNDISRYRAIIAELGIRK